MTTILERLATEPKHDPEILVPNVWNGLLRTVDALCPCGSTAPVRNGELGTHEPKTEWTQDGRRRAVIADAYGIGWTCRYSGRTVVLAAALARDDALTGAEKHARDATLARLRAGVTDTAPEGYTLPKPVADLFTLAETHGWTTQQAWMPKDDGFVLSLRVSRSGGWKYDLTYFLAPGVARQTRFGLCRTPQRPAPHGTPSLKAITTVIRANPVLDEEGSES